MKFLQRFEVDAQPRQNLLEVSEHEVVTSVTQGVLVDLEDLQTHDVAVRFSAQGLARALDDLVQGAEEEVQTVFLVILDRLEVLFERQVFVRCQGLANSRLVQEDGNSREIVEGFVNRGRYLNRTREIHVVNTLIGKTY